MAASNVSMPVFTSASRYHHGSGEAGLGGGVGFGGLWNDDIDMDHHHLQDESNTDDPFDVDELTEYLLGDTGSVLNNLQTIGNGYHGTGIGIGTGTGTGTGGVTFDFMIDANVSSSIMEPLGSNRVSPEASEDGLLPHVDDQDHPYFYPYTDLQSQSQQPQPPQSQQPQLQAYQSPSPSPSPPQTAAALGTTTTTGPGIMMTTMTMSQIPPHIQQSFPPPPDHLSSAQSSLSQVKTKRQRIESTTQKEDKNDEKDDHHDHSIAAPSPAVLATKGGGSHLHQPTPPTPPIMHSPLLSSSSSSLHGQQLHRRRERNRLLAIKTRLRKKFFLEELQQQLLDLQRDNARLKQVVVDALDTVHAEPILAECEALEQQLPLTSNLLWEACGGSGSSTKGSSNVLLRQDFNLVSSIQKSQHSFVITDPSLPDNPIVFVSDAFLTVTEYSREQVLGRNCRFLQGPLTNQSKIEAIRHALTHGDDVSVTLLNYTAHGTPFWNQLFIASLRDADGHIVNYIGVIVPVLAPPPNDPEHGKALESLRMIKSSKKSSSQSPEKGKVGRKTTTADEMDEEIIRHCDDDDDDDANNDDENDDGDDDD